MAVLYERITNAALPDWLAFQAAQTKINFQHMYDMQEGLRQAINKNFTDIKRVKYLADLSISEDPIYNTITLNPETGKTQGDILNVGQLFYDFENHTLTFLTDLGEYQEIGSNLGDVGKNNNGPTYEGAPVALSGVQGGHKLFEPALASVPILNAMVGVLTTSTNNSGILDTNDFGKISVFGEITIPDFRNLMENNDDSLLGFGTQLYLSAEEAGRYSMLPPNYPSASIWIATVTDFNISNHKGRMFIYPQRVSLNESRTFIQAEQPTASKHHDIWIRIPLEE